MAPALREFEALLLVVIAELGDDAYGLTIHDQVERVTGRSVAIGQIYTGLARLEERGLVRSTEAPSTAGRGGRPRRFYRLRPTAVADLRRTVDVYRRLTALIGAALPKLEGER